MQKLQIDFEKSLKELANLIGIMETEKDGWQIKLANYFSFDPSYISRWKKKGIPPKKLEIIKKMGYPEEMWYIAKNQNNQLGRVSESPGEYKNAFSWYYKAINEIFMSEDEKMINAFKANIHVFYEIIREKKDRLNKIKKLKHQIKVLQECYATRQKP